MGIFLKQKKYTLKNDILEVRRDYVMTIPCVTTIYK